MKVRHLLPGSLLLVVACVAGSAFARSPAASEAKLHQLDVSAGRWVYHGHAVGGHGTRPSAWTWNEDCHWADNHFFMLCSFSNTWGGRHVDSEVVDTYDPKADSFWHYELYNRGPSAANPFGSKMQIDGATRTESWTESRHGKSVEQRIVYRFASDSKVTVVFQQSEDGTHWKTTASGTGEKTQAAAARAQPSSRTPS